MDCMHINNILEHEETKSLTDYQIACRIGQFKEYLWKIHDELELESFSEDDEYHERLNQAQTYFLMEIIDEYHRKFEDIF
jgi:hypothetical protein